jgi:pSer/pThr/pTyr-binding forkhead associated (FHA) protein
MARLLIKTEGLEQQSLELRLGVNHVGRSQDCDFSISHPTISTHHCELIVSSEGVLLRDCHSTNGTFVNGNPIAEAWLAAGQAVKLGDVEFFVENTEINVAIPEYERPSQAAPVSAVMEDGVLSCPRHLQTAARYKCTVCGEVMCSACVRVMRRKGGLPHFLCVICSHECEPFQITKPKKKRGFFGALEDTVRLRFKHTISRLNGGK